VGNVVFEEVVMVLCVWFDYYDVEIVVELSMIWDVLVFVVELIGYVV